MRVNKESKRVYVAGALSAEAVDYLFNVHKHLTVSEEARRHGYAVYSPALDFIQGIKFGYSSYTEYFDNNLAWLTVSDAILLVPGWANSKGTQAELELAFELGVPVFDSIYDLNLFFTDGADAGRIVELSYDSSGKAIGVTRQDFVSKPSDNE